MAGITPVSSWQGRVVGLLTRHDKARMIAPALSTLGLSLVDTDAFDTDRLGTFSGEVERTLTPLECARHKAQLACELTGLDLGLGSEGSFGGGPMPGLVNWDQELLVLWDHSRGQEIVAHAAGPVGVATIALASMADLEHKLARFDAAQAWVLRHPGGLIKGLLGQQAILEQLALVGLSGSGGELVQKVTLEPDLRAMHCPERQGYIRQAAEQLAERLQSFCPRCSAANFWLDEAEKGLPCGCCGTPTELPTAFIRRCQACEYQIREPGDPVTADPGDCPWCNP
jgi:ribosomal protein S27AE